MRGRPRKPSKIKELEGNRSRRAIVPDLPLPGLPEFPTDLNADGEAHWRLLAGELGGIGVVKRVDGPGLHQLALLWQSMMAAYRAGEWKEWRDNLAKWMTLGGQFGLTPAARAKLVTSAPEAKDETEERYFKVTG